MHILGWLHYLIINYKFRHPYIFIKPKISCNLASFHITYHGSKLWNNLTNIFTNEININIFLNLLNKLLFVEY